MVSGSGFCIGPPPRLRCTEEHNDGVRTRPDVEPGLIPQTVEGCRQFLRCRARRHGNKIPGKAVVRCVVCAGLGAVDLNAGTQSRKTSHLVATGELK